MPTPAALENARARRATILTLIARSVTDRGYPPTIRELAADTGVSPRQVAKDIRALVDAGDLEHTPGAARSLKVTR